MLKYVTSIFRASVIHVANSVCWSFPSGMLSFSFWIVRFCGNCITITWKGNRKNVWAALVCKHSKWLLTLHEWSLWILSDWVHGVLKIQVIIIVHKTPENSTEEMIWGNISLLFSGCICIFRLSQVWLWTQPPHPRLSSKCWPRAQIDASSALPRWCVDLWAIQGWACGDQCTPKDTSRLNYELLLLSVASRYILDMGSVWT